MEGKVIEIRFLGEFLVVGSKEGYKLLNLDTCTLSLWAFEDEREMTTILDIVSVRVFRGER